METEDWGKEKRSDYDTSQRPARLTAVVVTVMVCTGRVAANAEIASQDELRSGPRGGLNVVIDH